ncbi:glycosyltransferase family 4 protein [Spirosoma sp. BT702]|uniref:Glycosyltransferase family 4 protein n=1 Tax=Spirosoma profusum TaxID=2771354 RepID=A0A927G9S6_9BACT|nr:glycosyltransferase family 1 protein [Spirosoma profusum]MBD2704798.1 glycosyltransferase family 4 protein [Spirosoma profusum]
MLVQFFLRSLGTGHSLETVFDTLQMELASHTNITTSKIRMPHISKGIRSIWKNLRFAARQQRNGLFHITGDIHYVALALPCNRTVLTIHDCILLEKNRRSPFRYAFFWLFWYYWPIRRAGIVTAISEKTRQELLRLVGRSAEKVRVIPNAIHPAFTYQPRPFCEKQPTFLQIGTAPHKNVLRLIDALENCPGKLILVGPLSDTITKRLLLRPIAHEHYQNLNQEEIVSLYQRCDMVCFVSLYEGFGMPILEAQAVGRPVLASQITPLTNIGGSGACYVDPTNVTSIRKGIEQICQDETYRTNLIQAGRKNVANFSAEAVAAEYKALYRELCRQQ